MASEPRSAQQGFTLIELLVAVMIFAMLTLAGVALLRGSVSAQGAVRERLDELNDVQRARVIIDADLAQTSTRLTRGTNGLFAPAFYGRSAQPSEPIMQFVRAGWSNIDNSPRATVQKVEYWFRNGAIERVGYERLDGARPQSPAIVIDRVAALSMRYRGADGEWREQWAPIRPTETPRAVEMIITRDGDGPVRMVFALAPWPEPPTQPEADNASGAN